MNAAPRIKLLIIDDQSFIRSLVAMRLNRKGYEVLEAPNTEEGLRVVHAHAPALIICDIMMPGEDGLAFCRRLRAGGNKTPFLFLTAKGQSTTVVEALASGADDFLVKPFDAEELEARVMSLLRRKSTTA